MIQSLDTSHTPSMPYPPRLRRAGAGMPRERVSAGNGTSCISFAPGSWHDVSGAGDVPDRTRAGIDIPPMRGGLARGAAVHRFDRRGARNAGSPGAAQPDRPAPPRTGGNTGRLSIFFSGELGDAFSPVCT